MDEDENNDSRAWSCPDEKGIPPHSPPARPTNTLSCSALAADEKQPWRLKPAKTHAHDYPSKCRTRTIWFMQVTPGHQINHMRENTQTHAYRRTDMQSCWQLVSRRTEGVRKSTSSPPPVSMETEPAALWGEERKPWVCTGKHTHTGWPSATRVQVKSHTQGYQWIYMHVHVYLYCVCCVSMYVCDCRTRWRCALRARETDTGETDVYSVGSALSKLQLALLPAGCCMHSLSLCVAAATMRRMHKVSFVTDREGEPPLPLTTN